MIEVERTWELDEAVALPPFDGLADGDTGDLTAVDGGTVELVATYHDTAGLRLARSRVTLRRRTGAKDAGWHLKLPAGRDREELQRPLGRAGAVPTELRALIRSRTRGEPVVPVVELRTTRHLVVVTDAAGNSAEIADDRVTATRLDAVAPDGRAGPGGRAGTGPVVTWREVEVELLDGSDAAVLDAVGAVLAAAGARPSDWQSKLGRALATTTGGAPGERPPPTGDVAAVLGYVAEQVAALTVQDPRVRLHEDDAVHAMRVATRRLRSTLHTFGALWRADAVDGVADQLHVLAAVLGEVRDREVLTERFTTTLLALATDTTGPDRELPGLLGRSAAELAASLVPGREEADRTLLRVLDARRHLRLLDRLVSLSEPASLVPAGAAADRSALFALVDPARHTLARRLRRAHQGDVDSHGARTDAHLHRARRAVKRTRYAAEALVSLGGGPARRFVDAHKALAQVLGDHQDAVVAREVLAAAATGGTASTGSAVSRASSVAFAAGLLYRDEQLRADAALAELPAVERAAGRRRVRRWLD